MATFSLSAQELRKVPASKEEEDLLTRSSKKTKNVSNENNADLLKGHWPKLGEKPPSFNEGGPSFADKLKGIGKEDDEMGNGQEDDLSDDSFSDHSTKKDDHEDDGWKLKFTNKEDYMNAIAGGPWMIYDHYLTVKPWEANFRPDKAEINKAAMHDVRGDIKRKLVTCTSNSQRDFGILAKETRESEEAGGNITMGMQVEGVTGVRAAGKGVQSIYEGGKGGSKKGIGGEAKGKKQSDLMEGEDKEQSTLVHQSSRRVDKRTREVSEGTSNGLLMLTMGDGMEEVDRTRLDPAVVKPLEDIDGIVLLSHEPGGSKEEPSGPGVTIGPVEANLGLMEEEVEQINGPDGHMELSMVPESPL
ncbi:hypothetical protein K1719_005708 [Acacia pycnantha]|nr:hypothetical protein K1719_005708 [Acacia pycnantha]